MKLSGVRLSVRPSVCLSVCVVIRLRHADAAGLLLWARRPADIDRLLHGRRSAAANANSATSPADVGGLTQSRLFGYDVLVNESLSQHHGRIKHLVGPTHFTMPGPQSK